MARPSTPSSTASSPSALPTQALAVLLSTGVATLLLAIYQWRELLLVRQGFTPACAINDTLNCAAVWNSPFATRLHDFFHVPIAGLGVVWGGAAAALAAAIFFRGRSGDAGVQMSAAKLWAWAGLLSIVAFGTASLRGGALCLTCLGTYVLVGAYAFGALKLLPGGAWPKSQELGPAVGWATAVGAVLFLVVLPVGVDTPKTTTTRLTADTPEGMKLAFEAMSKQDLLFASAARYTYQTGQPKDGSAFPARLRLGPPNAPVAVTDWTDIKCPHCKHLEEELEKILRLVPPDSISVVPRYFPLDGECNPLVQQVAGDGVRCMAAKVQLCLEDSTKYWDVRREMFERAEELTAPMIVDMAVKAGVDEAGLRACIASPDTQKKLESDIAYAKEYNIDGTPLLLVNGRETLPSAPFLLALTLAKGDANAPVFSQLPPPPLMK